MRSLDADTRSRVLACGVALLFTAPLLAWFDAPIHRPQDEGMLLVYPELILRGLLPHRDFLASYPPGNFFLLALCYQLFEPSIAVERIVGLAYRMVLVLGVVVLASRRGPIIGGVCGATTAVLLQPLRLEAFSWLGGLALIIWAAVALQRERHLLSGVLLGLALWFRLDLILAGALLAAGGIGAYRFDMRREVGLFTIGIVGPVVTLLLFFVVVSLPNAIDDLIVGPVFLTGPARRLPLSSLETSSIRLLLLLAIGLLTSLLAAWSVREAATSDRADSFIIAGLCVGLFPQAWQRLDADHLIYACAVVGGLFPLTLDVLLGERLQRVPRLVIAAVIIVTTAGTPAVSVAVKSLEHLVSRPPTAWLHRNERKLPARGVHEISAFAKLGAVLDRESEPGERLFIGPTDLSRTRYSDLHLYFFFPELIPASYYLELNPKSANRHGTRLTQDLETADWLLLSGEWDRWNEGNSSVETGDSRPNRAVREFFEKRAQDGVWKLYRRRGAG